MSNRRAWVLKLGLQGRAVVPKSNLSVTCVLVLLKRAKKLSSARGTVKSTHTDTALVWPGATIPTTLYWLRSFCLSDLHPAYHLQPKTEVARLKAEIAELKALLTTDACKVTLPSCTCREAIDNLKSDMQQLQLDVKRQALYTQRLLSVTVKHAQHAEHHKNPQHKGQTWTEKHNNGEIIAMHPCLPCLPWWITQCS